MDKNDNPSKHRHAPPKDTDESHIIRSENHANPNVTMYGDNNPKSSQEQKRDGVKADPSSFPGGERKKE